MHTMAAYTTTKTMWPRFWYLELINQTSKRILSLLGIDVLWLGTCDLNIDLNFDW